MLLRLNIKSSPFSIILSKCIPHNHLRQLYNTHRLGQGKNLRECHKSLYINNLGRRQFIELNLLWYIICRSESS